MNPWWWLAIFLLAVPAGILVFRRIRRSSLAARGMFRFGDLIADPSLWNRFAAKHVREEQELAEAPSWDDARIEAEVEACIVEGSKGNRILLSLGPKVFPALLALLRDPARYQALVTPDADGYSSKLRRAAFILFGGLSETATPPPPAETAAAFAAFANEDVSPVVRRAALSAIARTGDLTHLPLALEALREENEQLREAVLQGLDAGSVQPTFPAEAAALAFSSVVELFQLRGETTAARFLARLDPVRAREILLAPDVFRADSTALGAALQGLCRGWIPVERTRLLELKQELATGPEQLGDFLRSALQGWVWQLLGQQRDPADLAALQTALDSPDELVANGAAAGLLDWHDLNGVNDRLWAKVSAEEELNRSQRLYRAVLECDAEVCNGGLSQYFFNSAGDRWSEAVAGFSALGLPGRQEILAAAIAFFGPAGPSADRGIRQSELSPVHRRHQAELDALDQRYFDSREYLRAACARFVVEHASDFR